jgi:membrane protease YdiL (CAAX protease family)
MPSVLDMLVLAVNTYFLLALPQEILFRGLIQNGIARFAEAKLWRGPGSFAAEGPARLLHPGMIGLVGASLIAGLTYVYHPVLPPEHIALGVLANLGFGWVYQRTGKVTASAVAHMLVIWFWLIFFM